MCDDYDDNEHAPQYEQQPDYEWATLYVYNI